jgi:hypothetical protein
MATQSNDITPDDSIAPVYLEPRDEAQVEADAKEAARIAKIETDRAALKIATLEKLGLTADEVAALLS